jgi:membrane-associated phospholipid phosphatase
MILVLNFVVDSPRQFTHMAAGFVLLLGVQMACFLVFPVTTPEQWRHLNQKRDTSERFLALVHRFDATSNCFPSMHVSVAMLTAMYLAPHLGHGAFAVPLLIAVSCIFTKQHYLVDLPVGAALGWGVFHLTSLLEVGI